jgi:N-acetylglucosamine malate deacetylase 1
MNAKAIGAFRVLKRVLTGRKTRWILPALVMLGIGCLAFYFLVRPAVLPQPAIHLLDDANLPTQGQVVLVFAPHPDDETIGAGGYIAASIRQGATVKIVLVTDGNKGPTNHTSTRYQEFKKATEILGVEESNLIFMGFPDGKLRQQNGNNLQQQLKALIEQENPNFIIYPDARDAHPDHSSIGGIIDDILSEEGREITAYQYLVHYTMFFPQPHKFDPDLYLLPPISLVDFDKVWQRFLLPQEIEDVKLEATYTYKSQLRDPMARSLMLSSIRKNELFAIWKER